MGFDAPEVIDEALLQSNPLDVLAPEPKASEPKAPEQKVSEDDAWRREVLERVRKRRQARTHALPLFVEGAGAPPGCGTSLPAVAELPSTIPPEAAAAYTASVLGGEPFEVGLPDEFAPAPPVAASPLADPLLSLSAATGSLGESHGGLRDFTLRAQDRESPPEAGRGGAVEMPSQSLVERPRPALAPAGNRSLVADLPLVEPSRPPGSGPDGEPQLTPVRSISRVASMNDRAQAALIDVGLWSAMSATAFYFASRIARTSIMGLAPAWHGLALFALVLGAAYVLFFGGLSGATPGKIACGIQVRRYDGTSLGPLGALARGFLGMVGIALLGIGIWPAFWDKDRRGLHDRITDARVMLS